MAIYSLEWQQITAVNCFITYGVNASNFFFFVSDYRGEISWSD